MQKSGRARKQGDKEPEGITKSRILLYLADHNGADFYGLRVHLNKSMNIKSVKVIRDHLSALEESGLISKLKEPRGSGDYGLNTYSLGESFEGLKRVYYFLRDAGLEKDFMKTGYFTRYLASEDFRIKLYLSLYRSNIMYVCDLMKTPEGYARACEEIRELPEMQRDKFMGIMGRFQANGAPDEFVMSFIALIGYFTGDIDTACEKIKGHLAGRQEITRETPPEQYLLGISRLILPDDEVEEIFRILQVSPGAIDYIMDPRFNNPFITQSLMMGYCLTTILMDPEHADHMFGPGKDGEPFRDYPIYLTIRSLFIADLVNGRLTVDDIRSEMLKRVFSSTLAGMRQH